MKLSEILTPGAMFNWVTLSDQITGPDDPVAAEVVAALREIARDVGCDDFCVVTGTAEEGIFAAMVENPGVMPDGVLVLFVSSANAIRKGETP